MYRCRYCSTYNYDLFEQVNFDAAWMSSGRAHAGTRVPKRSCQGLVRINVSLLSPAVNLGQMYPAVWLDCPLLME